MIANRSPKIVYRSAVGRASRYRCCLGEMLAPESHEFSVTEVAAMEIVLSAPNNGVPSCPTTWYTHEARPSDPSMDHSSNVAVTFSLTLTSVLFGHRMPELSEWLSRNRIKRQDPLNMSLAVCGRGSNVNVLPRLVRTTNRSDSSA